MFGDVILCKAGSLGQGSDQKVRLGFWLTPDVAERFKAVARVSDGGMSQALTRMVGDAIGDAPAVAPSGVGRGQMVSVRFRDDERSALDAAARDRETTPANWVRSLSLVHLMRRPQWNRAQLAELREVHRELRAIGKNLNQIARAVNAAAQEGQCPPEAAQAALDAAEVIRAELRRVVAVYTGDFDYWGLPEASRPGATKAGIAATKKREATAAAKRKLAPRKRPTKFKD